MLYVKLCAIICAKIILGGYSNECYEKISIGTHNGIFHQDEVVAIALLSIIHGISLNVRRTRDPEILATCDYVVDIGGGEFDHHMPGKNGFRKSNSSTKPIAYASAGLVWKKYSHDILKIMECPEALLDNVSMRVDENIIKPVDMIDDGLPAFSLFDFIPQYIPNWDKDFTTVDKQFKKALTLTRKILKTAIKKEIANAKSDEIIQICIDTKAPHSSILEVPNQYINWKPLVIQHNKFPMDLIYFVVFPYPDSGYAAQAVPPSLERQLEQLIPFPSEWAGLTSALPKISGVETATFCHNNLFFVRADTKEDVIRLCEIAIEKIEKC